MDKNRGKVQTDSTGAESVKNWDPNDEFKETSDGKKFWQNHVSFGTQKGRYYLVESKEQLGVVAEERKSAIAKPKQSGRAAVGASARISTSG